FTDLVAVDPHERFDLGASGADEMRIVDLIAPIGKGTRQLIVSPPKAGKTILLEQIVQAIGQCSPQSRVIVLLVDERPEEVTHFRRSVEGAEVVASTSRSHRQRTRRTCRTDVGPRSDGAGMRT
ncbi:MAG: hypothetical protein ACYSWQ_30515, partial [Planctomycetota bacterium]